ncbi:hypothetical protein TIFTF001_032157 [Ficus carica]|uniref:Uncharacterized protein n=1 Tax=Ficus carica TaxID=3494 RepID=A0AA88DW80_FICCA|nr:hypothetical protein TIFTF001_032157 [Ficus carica]
MPHHLIFSPLFTQRNASNNFFVDLPKNFIEFVPVPPERFKSATTKFSIFLFGIVIGRKNFGPSNRRPLLNLECGKY